MSAVCGVVGLDGRPWTRGDLDSVVRALEPLGRDGRGTWAGTAGGCGVALGAVQRLSTPEDALDRQPAESRDGSLVLVADLRLDNRDELAALLDLADDGAVSDSAYILAAYERWGESFLEHIVGDFALAVVDRRRGGVLLARDHAGMRPLVIHERAGVVAFASTALALTGLPGVGHALDLRRAAEALALVYASDRTFVQGVRWVPPASALWVDAKGIRRWKWWAPDPHDVVDLGSPTAHDEELRQAFDVAVDARLRSVGKVAAMTSGGLDSSSVTATAACHLAPDPLLTYTSVPPPGWSAGKVPGWDADEAPLVRKLASVYRNIAPRFVETPRGNLFDLHEPLWELGSAPARNPCNLLWWHAIHTHARADGATTLLTGSRGNMQFSADGPDWLVGLLRAGRPVSAAKEAISWIKGARGQWYRALAAEVVYPVLPAPAQRIARAVTVRPDRVQDWLGSTAIRPELAADLDVGALVPSLRSPRPDGREVGLFVVQTACAAQADGRTAEAALTGAEERDPTLDRRVLEVAIRQPEWVRRRDGITRAVVRGAMAERLPPEILHRTRRGEQLPDWLDVMTAARAEIASEFDQLKDHPASRELIDVERLRGLLRRWPDRSRRADPHVVRDYRFALLRGLLISRYLRWFESRAALAARAE